MLSSFVCRHDEFQRQNFAHLASNNQYKRKEIDERVLEVLNVYGRMPWNYTVSWAYVVYSIMLSHRFQKKLRYWTSIEGDRPFFSASTDSHPYFMIQSTFFFSYPKIKTEGNHFKHNERFNSEMNLFTQNLLTIENSKSIIFIIILLSPQWIYRRTIIVFQTNL